MEESKRIDRKIDDPCRRKAVKRDNAEVLRDLLKSWIIRTVAQEPDVIDAAKKAYRDAVDSFALDDVETLIQTFKG